MTTDEELVMDLALSALENLFGIPDKWTGEGGGDVAVWRLGGSYRAQQAITAIKQARAAPVQKRPQNCGTSYCSCVECVMEPAPVQEPVQNNPLDCGVYLGSGKDHVIKHHVSYGPAQRTWVGLTDEDSQDVIQRAMHSITGGDNTFTLSANKIWVAIVREVEAKLREKNT